MDLEEEGVGRSSKKKGSSVRELEWGIRWYKRGRDNDNGEGRGRKGLKTFLNFFCLCALISLEIVLWKEVTLESWILLKASRYQLK